MTPVVLLQHRLRVHDAGTSTPGDGTVAFVIDQLSDVPEFGGQVVRPTEGSSMLGRWTFRAIDADGAITAELSDSDGRAVLIGRLAEIQERRNGGSWATVNVGRLTGLEEDEDEPGEYQVEVRDERWVEGRAKVFDVADTAALWPHGLLYRWRHQVAPASASVGPPGKAEQVDSDGSRRKVRLTSNRPVSSLVASWIRGDLIDEPIPDRSDGEGNFEHLRLRIGSTDYKVITFGDEIDGTDFVDQIAAVGSSRAYPEVDVWIWAPSFSSSGNAYLWAPTSPPSEALPLHLATVGDDGFEDSDHKWGLQDPWDLVEALYDEAGVRYDGAAFDALRALKGWSAYPRRVTDPDLTVREVTEEIYRAFQVVPFLDDAGRIAPKSVRLPDASTVDPSTLFEFNVSNCGGVPSFRHLATEVVNRVTVRGKLYQTKLSNPGNPPTSDVPGDASVERDVVIGPVDYESGTQEIGGRELVIDIPGVPPRGEKSAADNFLVYFGPKVATLEELAALIRAEIFDRFGDGPVRGEFLSLETPEDGSSRTPRDVQPGDLVRLNFPTLPNMATQERGGVRLVQIMSKRFGANGITWEYLDAGPALQPLEAPTVSIGANSGNPRHARDVTIGSIPSGARVQLRIGYGSGSDYTRTLDDVGSSVTLQGLPSGTSIRVQARAVAPGRVRSLWSSQASSTTATLPAPTSLSASATGRGMKLEWTPAAAGYPLLPVFRTAGGGAWTDALRTPLPPGSTVYVFPPQGASTSYDWGVQHVDEFGGRGTVGYATESTSTARELAAPLRPQVLQGRAAGGVDDLPDEELRIGYGIEVGFVSAEPAAQTVAEVSDDEEFGSIERTVTVPANASRMLIRTGALDETVRYIRLLHRRDGFVDSDPSAVVTSKPTALMDVDGTSSDAFPGGFASLAEGEGGTLELFVQDGGDPDTASAFVSWVKNPDPEEYPEIDTGTDRELELPARENLNDNDDPPVDETFADGDVALVQVAFADAAGNLGQRVLLRHVYGAEITTVSLDRIDVDNVGSGGMFELVVLYAVAWLRLPGSVESVHSTLAVRQAGEGESLSVVERDVDLSGGGLVDFYCPDDDGTTFIFDPTAHLDYWEIELFDDTGGEGGSGESLGTFRIVEDIGILFLKGGTLAYNTETEGEFVQGKALRFGADGKGDGVFKTASGAVVSLRDTFDAGDVSGTWQPDYLDGAAQIARLTGATALQVPDNWGTGRPMTLRINCNGNALTFQGSRFYAPDDGPRATDMTGQCMVTIELMSTNYVVTALLPNLTAL